MDLTGLVKPLVWEGRERDCYMMAICPFGVYEICVDYGDEWYCDFSGHADARSRRICQYKDSPADPQAAAQSDYAARALASIDADKIAALVDAVDLAANRLHSLSVEFDTGTRLFIEAGEWADDARAALSAFKGETP